MSKSMKTVLGVVVVLAVAAALAGYFVVIPNFEKKQADAVAAFFSELPGDVKADSINVSFFGKTVEINGLKGDTIYVIEGSDMHVDVESIRLTGVNLSAGNASGVVDLVDQIAVANAKFRIVTSLAAMGADQEVLRAVPGADKPIVQNLSLKEFEMKGLRGDYTALDSAMKAKASKKDIFTLLAGFSAASMKGGDYRNEMETMLGPVAATLASFEGKDMGMLRSGPVSFDKLSLTIMGTDAMRTERMAMESWSMPNIYGPLFDAQESGKLEEFAANTFWDIMTEQGMTMKGLSMEQVHFQFMMPEPVTIKKVVADVELAKGNLTMSQDFDSLVIPAFLYRNLSLEAAQFADYYGEALDITAGLDMVAAWKPGRADFNVKRLTLEDKKLAFGSLVAECYVEGEGEGFTEMMENDSAKPFLTKAEILMEDRALLTNVFGGEFAAIEAFGLNGEGMDSPEALREQAAQLLEEEAVATAPTPDLKLIMEGIVKLMRTPGKLTVALQPEKPVSLLLDDGASLGATVKYTPVTQ